MLLARDRHFPGGTGEINCQKKKNFPSPFFSSPSPSLQISDVKFDDGVTPFYFVHYQGWSKHWDEWVPDERVLKYTPENNSTRKGMFFFFFWTFFLPFWSLVRRGGAKLMFVVIVVVVDRL